MKTLLLYLLIPLAVFVLVFQTPKPLPQKLTGYLYYSPCDKPIFYRIDTVDERFGLSPQEFAQNVDSATKIWEEVDGKNLFVPDPRGKLSVNLVFDERQALNKQIVSLEGQLKKQAGSLKPNLAEYQKQAADFKARLDKLNDEINFWNSQGGAPKDEYEKIIKEQDELKVEAERLSEMAQSLNQSAGLYNASIEKLNKTIGAFNEELAEKPEEGIYDPNTQRIEIYFNIERDELVHTIAHEFGHSLGMGHVQDKKAIMHASTNRQIAPSPDDLVALNQVCQKRSYLDLARQRLEFIVSNLQQNFAQK